MAIKFVVLRTQDGNAVDPFRPKAKVLAGVGGRFEILSNDPADTYRVTVAGKSASGRRPHWPNDLPPGDHAVTIEQLHLDAVVDKREGLVTVAAKAGSGATFVTIASTHEETAAATIQSINAAAEKQAAATTATPETPPPAEPAAETAVTAETASDAFPSRRTRKKTGDDAQA